MRQLATIPCEALRLALGPMMDRINGYHDLLAWCRNRYPDLYKQNREDVDDLVCAYNQIARAVETEEIYFDEEV